MLLEKCSITGRTPKEYIEGVSEEEDFFLSCAISKKYNQR